MLVSVCTCTNMHVDPVFSSFVCACMRIHVCVRFALEKANMFHTLIFATNTITSPIRSLPVLVYLHTSLQLKCRYFAQILLQHSTNQCTVLLV